VPVIAPGPPVATPFLDSTPMRHPLSAPLQPEGVARAVLYALQQPRHVDVNEILFRATEQAH